MLLEMIETEGKLYGMKLNKGKCEYMSYDRTKVRFSDGTKLTPKEDVKYLGCYLNKKADGGKELNRRIIECMTLLEKFDLFWRHGDCTVRQYRMKTTFT